MTMFEIVDPDVPLRWYRLPMSVFGCPIVPPWFLLRCEKL